MGLDDLREFAMSSNGDRWLLGGDRLAKEDFVIHRANAASGGHETRTSVNAFLNLTPPSPEREALLAVLADKGQETPRLIGSDEGTPSFELAQEYLRLGGSRRAKLDDNIVSTRRWQDEPADAEAFWKEHIEPLNDTQRQEVERYLPSISDA